MDYDYRKRDYLLPPGCKDLIDAQKLRLQKALEDWQERQQQRRPAAKPLPPVVADVVIAEHTTVFELALILSQKPFQIIADLMEMGIFAQVATKLDFKTIEKVTRRYGYTAKEAI